MPSPAPAKKVGLEVIQPQHRQAGEKLCREGLEVLVDNLLSISQQSTLAATWPPSTLACINGSIGRRRVIFPLRSAPHLVSSPAPNINKLKQTWTATKAVRGLQEQDESAQLVRPRQETALQQLIATPQYSSHKEHAIQNGMRLL